MRQLVERLSEPMDLLRAHRDRIRQPWYPVQERYGLVFAYMGPPEKKPVLPYWDALEDLAPDETIFATDSSFSVGGEDSIQILPWNWLQDWENSTDPWHVYILHTAFSSSQFAPEMAVKLEKAIGSTADTWLRMQMNYDLAQVRKRTINVKRLVPA